MEQILSWAKGQTAAYTLKLRELVECESPSDNPVAVNRFVELLSDMVTRHAKLKTVPGGKFGKHLLL